MGAKAMSSSHGGGALSPQGSLCSLTFGEVEGHLHGVDLDGLVRAAEGAAAGKRTADEVWRDIQHGAGAGCPRAQMTLEDFLCRAADAAGAGSAGARGWAQQQQYQPAPAQLSAAQQQHHHGRPAVGQPVPRPLGVGAGLVLDGLYHDGLDGAARKRVAGPEGGDGVGERTTVERRKKRMIKNRESAARSRARKQAYTNELENKISQLEEENERLRSHKALEPVVEYVPRQEPKNQLRRTNSASF